MEKIRSIRAVHKIIARKTHFEHTSLFSGREASSICSGNCGFADETKYISKTDNSKFCSVHDSIFNATVTTLAHKSIMLSLLTLN